MGEEEEEVKAASLKTEEAAVGVVIYGVSIDGEAIDD